MAETLSLMEFLQALLADGELRGHFGDDPQGTLDAHGLADLTPADVHDALVLVQDNQTVEYALDAAAIAPPPPPPAGDDHEAAVEYLARYLTDPHQDGPDARWVDPDADATLTPAAPEDAPFGAFAAGDNGYGSGSPADDGAWAIDPDGAGSDSAGGYHHDFGTAEFHAAEFHAAEFGTTNFDTTGDTAGFDVADDDQDWPDDGDAGTALPAGA